MKRIATAFTLFLLHMLSLSFTLKSSYGQDPAPPITQPSPESKPKFRKAENAIPNRYIVVLKNNGFDDGLRLEARRQQVTAIAEKHAKAYKGKFDYIYETALKGYA